MKFLKNITVLIAFILSLTVLGGCLRGGVVVPYGAANLYTGTFDGPTIDDNDTNVYSVNMLITGFVNLPPEGDDPYKNWIRRNYNLDIALSAVGDMAGTAPVRFASNIPPDVVVFDSINTYRAIADQGFLLDDWSECLKIMPNASNIVEMKDADNPEGDSIAKQIMTTKDGTLGAIWTLPDTPTWSLKIREDWANEYRATTVGGHHAGGSQYTYPAGNVATNGGPWQPNTPEDLLNFARWIRATKSDGRSSQNKCYAFTSAGGGNSMGTLGNWLPLMWGSVAEMPYGAYINQDGQVDFAISPNSTDYNNFTHKKYMDFLKKVCSEGLIEPNWYSQNWNQKDKTAKGLIGIEWYPGSISAEAAINNKDIDTDVIAGWWKTYPLPCAEGYDAGYMPVEGYVGKIICVSKEVALYEPKKLAKICKFIDDCLVHYDADTGKYVRTTAYDALRWGVGIEDYHYQDIENSDFKYINTANENCYRASVKGAGAWDWGAWMSTSRDGIIQGSSETIDAITMKVIEHNIITSQMKSKIQIGSALNLTSKTVKTLNNYQIQWEHCYVTGLSCASYPDFVNGWFSNSKGGNKLLAESRTQFISLGILKS